MPTYSNWGTPPRFLGDPAPLNETSEAQTARLTAQDLVAQMWAVNQLLPYMGARQQAQAMNWIYENQSALSYVTGGLQNTVNTDYGWTPNEMPGQQNWWDTSNASGRRQTALATQANELASQMAAGGLGTSPWYESLKQLGRVGTLLGSQQPLTAGQQRESGIQRRDLLGGLSGLGGQWQQLGSWFADPEFKVPSITPNLGRSSGAGNVRGGGQSWWG